MATAQAEGPAQVGKTFGSIEEGLLVGMTDAPESLLTTQLAPFGEDSSDFVRLIEPSPPLSSPVQRNGDEDPGRIALCGHPRIVPDFFGQKGELTMQVDLPSVLVGMHEFACRTLRAGSRPGKIEGEFQSTALTAEHIVSYDSFDLFSTLDAIGFLDPRKTIPAGGAEVAPVPEGGPAQAARWRVEEIEPASEGHLGRTIQEGKSVPRAIRDRGAHAASGYMGSMEMVPRSALGRSRPVDGR